MKKINLLVLIATSLFLMKCNPHHPVDILTFTDQDANTYPVSFACNQIWSAKNLNTSKYKNGVSIPRVTDPTQWSNLTTGAYCSYNNDPANDAIYGKLYNWYAVHDTINGGISPSGWHIASKAEWDTLINCLGGRSIAGGKLKETGLAHWDSTEVSVSNMIGFSSIGNGNRDSTGTYLSLKKIGYYWTSTISDLDSRKAFFVNTYSTGISTDWGDWKKTDGLAVRLVKD